MQSLVMAAADAVNAAVPEDQRIPLDPGTMLTGPSADLDSLTLTSLLLEIERRIAETAGDSPDLFSQPALFDPDKGVSLGDLAKIAAAATGADLGAEA